MSALPADFDASVRANLALVTGEAVAEAQAVISPDVKRTATVISELAPILVAEYGNAAATLASDYYDALRSVAPHVGRRFVATNVVPIRRDLIVGQSAGWALAPLRELHDLAEAQKQAAERLAEVIQLETARAFRETIQENSRRDDDSVGWSRIARADGCPLCRMLADRGAVYTKETARFAAHPDCHCTARASFKGQNAPEASVMQYQANRRKRSPAQQLALKEYLHQNFGGPAPTYALIGGQRVPVAEIAH